MELGADVVALAVEHHVASALAVVLDVSPRYALGRVADEGQFGAYQSGILYHH